MIKMTTMYKLYRSLKKKLRKTHIVKYGRSDFSKQFIYSSSTVDLTEWKDSGYIDIEK